MFALPQTCRLPSKTSFATPAGILLTGHPKIAIAMKGSPPMAYTSLIAFTDAIDPKVNGSSTIGMKKSVVLMTQVPSSISKTAASSFD